VIRIKRRFSTIYNNCIRRKGLNGTELLNLNCPKMISVRIQKNINHVTRFYYFADDRSVLWYLFEDWTRFVLFRTRIYMLMENEM